MKRSVIVVGVGVTATGLLLSACVSVREPAMLVEQARTARTPEAHRVAANGYCEYAAHLRSDAIRDLTLAESLSDPAREVDADGGRHARTTAAFRRQEARHCRALADYLSGGRCGS
jgi:hypothetical protein